MQNSCGVASVTHCTLSEKVIRAVCDGHIFRSLWDNDIKLSHEMNARGCVTTIYVNGCVKRSDLRILPPAPQQFSIWAMLLLQSLSASQWELIWILSILIHMLQIETITEKKKKSNVGRTWQSCKCRSLIHHCDVKAAFAVVSANA